MDRRNYLKASSGAFAALALAGCLGDSSGSGSDDETSESGDGEKTSSKGTEKPDTGKIIVGSDYPYKPFEYKKVDGSLTGFDPAIAKAIFEGQLNREYEFKKAGFDTIIDSLKNENFRLIMSAMTITDERAEKVDFSDPYFTAYQTVAIRKESGIEKLDDLKGKTVAVQKGTTGESAAEKVKEDFGGSLTIHSYDQISGAFNALRNQQAVAVINDNTVNAEFVNKMDSVVFLEGEGEAAKQGKNAPDYLTLTVEEYGIAFRKDDDDFRKKVNEAIKTIKDDGTYDEIYGEYFEG
ncbi:basic amino acid ABC transporter substrate-binding protein [Haladaptatus sp. DYF46]|uniref:basic amino acid ABC transporter substrate-binding protein n=1 Tax=Haladaptatus sp. DYF46 TaxID=2886041 RepID=UPI001E5F749D|nr:basic amino acid ABC transporter substrate-binding protein [Haladaptatus sp. DYF46]